MARCRSIKILVTMGSELRFQLLEHLLIGLGVALIQQRQLNRYLCGDFLDVRWLVRCRDKGRILASQPSSDGLHELWQVLIQGEGKGIEPMRGGEKVTEILGDDVFDSEREDGNSMISCLYDLALDFR